VLGINQFRVILRRPALVQDSLGRLPGGRRSDPCRN
jgi:hypothetical protein